MKNSVLQQFGALLSLLSNYFDWKGNLCCSSRYSQVFYSFFSVAARNVPVCCTHSHSSQLPLHCKKSASAVEETCPGVPFLGPARLYLLPQLMPILGKLIGKVNIRNCLASWRDKTIENNLAFLFFLYITLHFFFTWLSWIYWYLDIKLSDQSLSVQISGCCFHPAAH